MPRRWPQTKASRVESLLGYPAILRVSGLSLTKGERARAVSAPRDMCSAKSGAMELPTSSFRDEPGPTTFSVLVLVLDGATVRSIELVELLPELVLMAWLNSSMQTLLAVVALCLATLPSATAAAPSPSSLAPAGWGGAFDVAGLDPDADGDGCWEKAEIARFLQKTVGGPMFDSAEERAAGVERVLASLDRGGGGKKPDGCIKASEVRAHVDDICRTRMPTAHDVALWMRFSGQQPKAAAAFGAANMRCEQLQELDDGALRELGVATALERKGVMRTVALALCGLGDPPAAPLVAAAAAAGEAAGAAYGCESGPEPGQITVRFGAPPPTSDAGSALALSGASSARSVMDVRSYSLERNRKGESAWEMLVFEDVEEPFEFVDDVAAEGKGRYRYRVRAWNHAGGSSGAAGGVKDRVKGGVWCAPMAVPPAAAQERQRQQPGGESPGGGGGGGGGGVFGAIFGAIGWMWLLVKWLVGTAMVVVPAGLFFRAELKKYGAPWIFAAILALPLPKAWQDEVLGFVEEAASDDTPSAAASSSASTPAAAAHRGGQAGSGNSGAAFTGAGAGASAAAAPSMSLRTTTSQLPAVTLKDTLDVDGTAFKRQCGEGFVLVYVLDQAVGRFTGSKSILTKEEKDGHFCAQVMGTSKIIQTAMSWTQATEAFKDFPAEPKRGQWLPTREGAERTLVETPEKISHSAVVAGSGATWPLSKRVKEWARHAGARALFKVESDTIVEPVCLGTNTGEGTRVTLKKGTVVKLIAVCSFEKSESELSKWGDTTATGDYHGWKWDKCICEDRAAPSATAEGRRDGPCCRWCGDTPDHGFTCCGEFNRNRGSAGDCRADDAADQRGLSAWEHVLVPCSSVADNE